MLCDFQLFSIVGLLGSTSMPQNHYLSIISFLRRSLVKKTYRNQITNVILWTNCLVSKLKMSVGFHKFKNGKPAGTLQPARDASIWSLFCFSFKILFFFKPSFCCQKPVKTVQMQFRIFLPDGRCYYLIPVLTSSDEQSFRPVDWTESQSFSKLLIH